MTGKQIDTLRGNAADTLESLEQLPGELTKDQAILYGAMTAIKDHFKAAPETPVAKETPETPRDAAYFANEELKAADTYYGIGENKLARDELKHAEYWISKARSEAYTPEARETVNDLQLRYDIMARVIV